MSELRLRHQLRMFQINYVTIPWCSSPTDVLFIKAHDKKLTVASTYTTSSPRKYREKEKWSNLLKGQSFYIHLPDSQKTKRLEKRLDSLGAVSFRNVSFF